MISLYEYAPLHLAMRRYDSLEYTEIDFGMPSLMYRGLIKFFKSAKVPTKPTDKI